MSEAVTVRIQKIKKNTIKGRLIFFLILVAILLLITVFADKIVPYDPYVQDLNQSRQAPSAAHWMGTDQYGRDVFSRVVVGAQTSIFSTLALVALVLCLIQFAVGRAIGRRCGDRVVGAQGLAQKNTVLAVWMAWTYFDPVSSVAPAAYIAWQNIINSIQLYLHGRHATQAHNSHHSYNSHLS